MLSKYEMAAPQSELDHVDTLRYSWERLQTTATKVAHHLLEIQPNFKDDLLHNVIVFNEDCKDFYKNYNEVRSSSASSSRGVERLSDDITNQPEVGDGVDRTVLDMDKQRLYERHTFSLNLSFHKIHDPLQMSEFKAL